MTESWVDDKLIIYSKFHQVFFLHIFG